MSGRQSTEELVVEADGGSRGNPGPAGYGALVRSGLEVLAERAEFIGTATNNVAEYRGLLAGLEAAAQINPRAFVHVRMDSKLVIEQMSGRWKIKHPDMRELASMAKKIFPAAQVSFEWIPRAQNSAADALANEAMDGGPGTLIERTLYSSEPNFNSAEQNAKQRDAPAREQGDALFELSAGNDAEQALTWIAFVAPGAGPLPTARELAEQFQIGTSARYFDERLVTEKGLSTLIKEIVASNFARTIAVVAEARVVGAAVANALDLSASARGKLNILPRSITVIGYANDGAAVEVRAIGAGAGLGARD